MVSSTREWGLPTGPAFVLRPGGQARRGTGLKRFNGCREHFTFLGLAAILPEGGVFGAVRRGSLPPRREATDGGSG